MPRRTRLLALTLAMALAPVVWLRSPKPPPNREQVLALTPVPVRTPQVGPFQLTGVWHLTSPNHRFGSYSALLESAPGRLQAFSDRGDFIELSVPGGAIAPARIELLPAANPREKRYRDLEAATRDPVTGQVFLALEGQGAVARYRRDLTLEAARTVPEMAAWGSNTGPEAMVRLADGRFVILCECRTGLFASGEHPALLFAGDPDAPGAASRFTFVGAAGYRPTDMTPLPDGRVLVLERRITWPMPPRFAARLLLADPDQIAVDGIWRGVELAKLAEPLPVDNFEALTVTQGKDGKLAAWLLSDDNQALSQRTLLLKLEFALEDLPTKQKAPGTPDAPASNRPK